jgi:hypothetical protein
MLAPRSASAAEAVRDDGLARGLRQALFLARIIYQNGSRMT